MPTYEYKCAGCQAVIDLSRPIDERDAPVRCPLCGGQAEKILSSFAFPHSKKAWSGRKCVNFEVDDRVEIAKKQAALMANSGKMDAWFNKTKMSRKARKAHEDAVASMIKKAPPVKVEL